MAASFALMASISAFFTTSIRAVLSPVIPVTGGSNELSAPLLAHAVVDDEVMRLAVIDVRVVVELVVDIVTVVSVRLVVVEVVAVAGMQGPPHLLLQRHIRSDAFKSTKAEKFSEDSFILSALLTR